MRRSWIALAVTLYLALPALAPQARSPLRLATGCPLGGGIDVFTRMTGDKQGGRLGRVVVVENRTGAGDDIAAELVAKTVPGDSAPGAVRAEPMLANRRLPVGAPLTRYDPARVGGFVTISARHARPVPAVPACRHRGSPDAHLISCGRHGHGTTQHLATALLVRTPEWDWTIVRYCGTARALPDPLDGTITMYIDTLVTDFPPTRDGPVRILAVASSQRLSFAPDVPVVAETVPGPAAETWLTLMAPRQTPEGLRARLEQVMREMARELAVEAGAPHGWSRTRQSARQTRGGHRCPRDGFMGERNRISREGLTARA